MSTAQGEVSGEWERPEKTTLALAAGKNPLLPSLPATLTRS